MGGIVRGSFDKGCMHTSHPFVSQMIAIAAERG
jgi:hypothetical protein